MFRKTGLGQQLEIIPGPTQGGAQPAGQPGGGSGGGGGGGNPREATLDPAQRLQELLDQANAEPEGWQTWTTTTTQPASGTRR